MSNAMLSGVGGLKAHQQMIDVAGNNLANVNTTSFKSSSVTFQELLAETLKEASAPTNTLGGTNPMQIGSGVITGAVNRDMSQGSLIYTGNPLDMAIEGAGYFTLNDGIGDYYTRVGQFAVDSEYFLVDPTNGYRVQRIGNEGVSEGFQDAVNNNIRIPYDIALPAQETETLSFAGNLSGNKNDPTQNLLTSDQKYTIAASGAVASQLTPLADLAQTTNLLGQLDQANYTDADAVMIEGMRKNGDRFKSYYRYNAGGVDTAERVVFDTGNSPLEVSGPETLVSNSAGAIQYVDMTVCGENIQIAVPAGGNLTTTQFVDEYNNNTSGNSTPATLSTMSIVDGQIVILKDTAGLTSDSFTMTVSDIGVTWNSSGKNPVTTDTHHFAGQAAASNEADTIGDFLSFISSCFDEHGTAMAEAKMANGNIRIEDKEAGYSRSFISSMEFNDNNYDVANPASFTTPGQFDILVAGGQVEKPVNTEVFDAQGNSFTLAASFVRTDKTNTWDFVVKSVGGDTEVVDRFVRGIGFQVDGSFGDMQATDTNTFELAFPSDPTNIRSIRLDMGTLGELDGLTQFGGPSTAASAGQDGYAAGWLSTMSVSREGTLVGVFSNGIRRDIAALKIATFQNAAGLKGIGGNYYEPTANSGDPVPNKATEGGAGVVHGGAIEKSNVEVAGEFVKLIEAQNGYQANAKTIKVANEMLRELTNLIR